MGNHAKSGKTVEAGASGKAKVKADGIRTEADQVDVIFIEAGRDTLKKDPAQEDMEQKSPAQEDMEQKSPAQEDTEQKRPEQKEMSQKDISQEALTQGGMSQKGMTQEDVSKQAGQIAGAEQAGGAELAGQAAGAEQAGGADSAGQIAGAEQAGGADSAGQAAGAEQAGGVDSAGQAAKAEQAEESAAQAQTKTLTQAQAKTLTPAQMKTGTQAQAQTARPAPADQAATPAPPGQPAKGTRKKRNICVVGHKNPDTDSICSAIAYTYLKNRVDDKFNYVPCRAGQINSETRYVLDTFKAEIPPYLDNIGTRVKDMEIREVPAASRDISIKKAWNLMRTENVFTLPITDKDGMLQGLITTNDIAKAYMDENDSAIVSAARTPYRNILETLEGRMIVGDRNACFEKGKVVIAAANPDVMENYIDEHDMVVLGNRYEGQLCAIEMNAGCIVVCLDSPVSRTIQTLAREKGCTIIVTPLDTYAVARLINQSMPVAHFMRQDSLVTFHRTDFTEEIKEIMSKMRYRDFPILNKRGVYQGMISRRNLLGVRKRPIILVDHNEVSQAVDHVEDADIREIIDHHRLGSLETMNPVFFRNQPVGCTATIIWQMFLEQGQDIPPKIAGLLCSAILSDTLCFRSPTCTPIDVTAARQLADIAGIECEQHAAAMFAAGSDLSGKSPEEIFYQDFKTFVIGEKKLGIGQINSMSSAELDKIKKRMVPFLKKAYNAHELDMFIFMLTNILEESSEMLCYGEHVAQLVEDAFPGVHVQDNAAVIPTVVSRKKQVVPALISAMNRGMEL